MAAALPLTGGYAVLLGDDQAAAADRLLALVRLANADHLRWRLGLRAERRVERWVEREPWAVRPFGRLELRPAASPYQRRQLAAVTYAAVSWTTFGPHRLAAVAADRSAWGWTQRPFAMLPPLRGYHRGDPLLRPDILSVGAREDALRTLAWLVERQLDPAEAMFAESRHGRREIDENDLGPIADWLEEHDHPVDAVRVWMACRGHF